MLLQLGVVRRALAELGVVVPEGSGCSQELAERVESIGDFVLPSERNIEVKASCTAGGLSVRPDSVARRLEELGQAGRMVAVPPTSPSQSYGKFVRGLSDSTSVSFPRWVPWAVGGTLGVILLTTAIWFILRRRKKT